MSTTHIYTSNVWHVSILFSRSGSALTRFIPPQQCPLSRNYPDRHVIFRLRLTVSCMTICDSRKPGMNPKLMSTGWTVLTRQQYYELLLLSRPKIVNQMAQWLLLYHALHQAFIKTMKDFKKAWACRRAVDVFVVPAPSLDVASDKYFILTNQRSTAAYMYENGMAFYADY